MKLLTIKNKLFFTSLLSLVTLAYPAFSQTSLSINRITTSDPKVSLYIASSPILAKESDNKSIMLAPQFTSDTKTDSLSGIRGLKVFAKGIGKCFLRDTLQLSLQNGKKLTMISASPMFCEQQLSGWFDMTKEELTTLFSAPLIQINFKNTKTGETFTQDITEKQSQEYFREMKKVYDTMAMYKPA